MDEEDMTSLEDLYPSRCLPYPQWLPRRDPVVYGGLKHSDGPLSRAELEAYERDGFLFFPQLFSAQEVARFCEELERLSCDPEVLAREGTITEPDSGDLRTVFELHKVSALFAELARDPRLAAVAAQLLDDDVYVNQSRLNYKPGFRAKEFYWHSDFETWHVEDGMPRMRALSISVTLTENYALNGPLMVIPGSHRHFLSCVGRTPEDHYKTSLKKQAYGVPDDDSLRCLVEEGGIFMTTGKAGSVTVFDCNLMHGSNSNITPFPRSNAFFAYNAMSNTLAEPFGGTQRRPDFLSERQPVPLKLDRQAA
jgi:ectoine hydroxylase